MKVPGVGGKVRGGGRNTAALVDCICDSRVEKKELLLTFSDEAIVAAEWYLPEF